MSDDTYTIHRERVIEAPRPVVCRAWTEPDRLKLWYRPDDTWSTPTAEMDVRVGGAYRIGLTPPGGTTFYEIGRFEEVSLPDRLRYTVRFEGVHLQFEGAHLDQPTGEEMEQYETMITAAFEPLSADRTRVVVTHDGYRSAQDRDRHREGWPRFLDRLATHCLTAR
jgi:uncharacterized protein YndB with AHSA1/START domain